MPNQVRIPPHSDEAERSVLGAALIDQEAFFKVFEVVKSGDFYSAAHREIFDAMISLYQQETPIDIVTTVDALRRRGSLEAAGGRAYVSGLSAEVPTSANAVQYARIVADKAVRRRLISAASEIAEKSFEESLESSRVMDYAEGLIYNVAKEKQTKDYSPIGEIFQANLAGIEEAQKLGTGLTGLSTGYRDLDRMTSGLQKSDLIILAARPSMGKSAFALNIAESVALREKKRTVIFSLEMSKEQIGLRLLSMKSRVDSNKLRVGNMTEDDWDMVREAVESYADADLIVDATPNISVMEVRNKCRRINSERRIDLIIIDYLQMMSSDISAESRQQEITQISRYLKQLAREMECPVIALSQLSRAVEQRQGDKRPVLSDLRESGAIEQDADVVMFLHRKDYYKKKEEPHDNECEVIIAKQRMGETGSVYLTWLPNYTKFVNIIRENR